MMKRPGTPIDGRTETKKHRSYSSDYFDDLSKEIRWLDIEHVLSHGRGEEDADPGWIFGTVFMIFGSKNKSEAQLKSGIMYLRISISCPEYHAFKFVIGQSLKISLRAVCIIGLKGGTSAPGHLPFSLCFNEGAAIQSVSGGRFMEDGTIVDTWRSRLPEESDREKAQEAGDWFFGSQPRETSSPIPKYERATTSSSHSSPFPETPGRNARSISLESSVAISNGIDSEGELAVDVDVQNFVRTDISKGKAPVHHEESDESTRPSVPKPKKIKKRDTRHKYPHSLHAESTTDSPEPAASAKLSRAERKRRKQQARSASGASSGPPKRNCFLDFTAGISTENGAYPSLDSVIPNTTTHVMGVVSHADTPFETKRGDFSVSVILIDPSNFQNGTGFKVTCFMKAGFAQLLPTVEKGNVLLLRNVRATQWRGNINGTVYPERVKWVEYNVSRGKLRYPDAVEQQTLSHDLYDARHEPRDNEIQYLKNLGEWWKAIKEEEERGAIQIADYSRKGGRREHRLIGCCKVDEFFDATVEILRVEKAESNQTTLLFTDYTPHPQRSTDGYYGQYSMHASTGRIMEELLDTMHPGTFVFIKNMRLKTGSTGSLEADLYGAEMSELERDENDSRVRELLRRKEAYLKEHPENPGESNVADTLVSHISHAGHYNIIAELVYRRASTDKVMDLYVTDYTENPKLSTYKPEQLKRQLNGLSLTMLQISAWDGHEFVRALEIGRVYSFCDVRIKESPDCALKGNLKFTDKRVTRMKSQSPSVLDLLQRKKEYNERLEHSSLAAESNAPTCHGETTQKLPIVLSNAIQSRHTDQPPSTIAQIKSAQKCPNKFRVVARIVDFYPLDISGFTLRICTNCNKRIPEKYHACTYCEDLLNEYVDWVYDFRFMLEDEDGSQLEVIASDEAKYFLRGLKACDLKENREVLLTLKRRLRGCLGNLVEVHEGLKRGEAIEPQSAPYFDLAVKSCESDSERIYALTGCEVVEPKATREC